MLTSITLQNFKGIGDPVTIPIRPLTILFGKNSAGKSTVVQALHYAREVLVNHNPNADRTELGGWSMDLGGFKSLVHRHDYKQREIRMSFNFDLSSSELPEYYDWDAIWEYENAGRDGLDPTKRVRGGLDFVRFHGGRNLFDALQKLQGSGQPEARTSAEIGFSVRWSDIAEKAVIVHYWTRLSDHDSGQIVTSLDGQNSKWSVNLNNRLLKIDDEDWNQSDDKEVEINWFEVPPLPGGRLGALPEWGRPIYLSPFSELLDQGVGYNTVSQLLTGAGDLLIGYLLDPGIKKMRYIGPLREVPPRNFAPVKTLDRALWANGLAAWHLLYNDQNYFVNIIGNALGSNGLKTGYTVERESYREIPMDSDLMLGLQNGDLLDRIDDTTQIIKSFPIRQRLRMVEESTGIKFDPADIGVGISQVLPIVVAAKDSLREIVAIEQPELHLHPAVQAELGDLFVTSMNDQQNIFILETHSEHLILRVLRRIREFEEGDCDEPDLEVRPDDVSLIFVEPSPGGVKLLPIPVTPEGDLEKHVPGGFFAERAAELF